MEFPNLGKHCKMEFCNKLGENSEKIDTIEIFLPSHFYEIFYYLNLIIFLCL